MTIQIPSQFTHQWLKKHAQDLLAFGQSTASAEGGALWLNDDGSPALDKPTYAWITSRMTHVYGIAAILGETGARATAQQAFNGLINLLHDPVNSGWYSSVAKDGTTASGKSCYDHAFVLLAAATAVHARLDDAATVWERAQRVFIDRFWDDKQGLCVDTWDTEFTVLDEYRGLNANMHAVEAMLSAATLTGDDRWIERSTRICRFVNEKARAHEWRIPEHFDSNWQPIPSFNHEHPDHPFKPYGATVGHGFEWARLFLHVEAAHPQGTQPWLMEAAQNIYNRAVADGWAVGGYEGFEYTTDWSGRPVVRDRMHWVVAEAINAASALHKRTNHPSYERQYQDWWTYAARYVIDPEYGSWHHQLDPTNRPTETVWQGKPDIYHAFQATLSRFLPLYPMITGAVAEGYLV